MKKLSIVALLVGLLAAAPALAQGPSGGGAGPQPPPSPWIVNGATISYNNGGLTIPSTVPGGTKGIGTINVSNGYYENGVRVHGVTSATEPILFSGGVISFDYAHAGTFTALQTFTAGVVANSVIVNGCTLGGSVICGSGLASFATLKLNSQTTGGLPTALTGSLIQAGQANGVVARIELDAYGAIAAFTGVSYGGTAASPTAVTSGTQLTGVNAYAYNGASAVGPIASFRTYAAENIASGHQGSNACIATTSNAATTLTDRWCIGQDGALVPQATSTYNIGSTVSQPNNIYTASLVFSNQVSLTSDVANSISQRNGASAQTFNIYGTYTDPSNYERLAVAYTGGIFQLTTQAAGTGVVRALKFNAGAGAINIDAANVSITDNLIFSTDNVSDIGASGATRPRNIYVGTSVTAGGSFFAGAGGGLYVGTSGSLLAVSDGVWQFTNNAGTGWTRLILGTNDSSGVAIKKTSQTFGFRNGNDSGDANITTAGIVASGDITTGNGNAFTWSTRSQIRSSADGLIELFNAANTGFTRLNLGGTSASFPAIKRNGTNLNFRLADDSADTSFTASQGLFSSGVTSNSGQGTPAGGAGAFFMGSAAVAIGWGSGAPTFSQPQGTLYLRTDGGVGTRLYVNTNGTTGYVAMADVNVTSLSSLATVGTLSSGTLAFGSLSFTGTVPGANVATAADASGSPSATFGVIKCDGTTVVCASGIISAVGGVATSIAVGTTTITSGTPGRILYDNTTLGELASLTGSSTAITVVSASLVSSGSISAAAWTTAGLRLKFAAASYTDTSSSGTVATAYSDFHGATTILASSSTTYTNYFGAYFQDPVASTNVTMTNKWALGADSAKLGTSNQVTFSTAGVVTVPGTLNVSGAFQIAGNAMTFPAAAATLTWTVATGAKALGTTAVASGACSSAVTDTATGGATTDVIDFTFSADPTATTGYAPSTSGGLYIVAWVTTNTANFKYCNNTSASITPGATTLNWRVRR